jgi:hypothetical protein
MWRRSLAWIETRPADNPADDPDDGKYPEAHGPYGDRLPT